MFDITFHRHVTYGYTLVGTLNDAATGVPGPGGGIGVWLRYVIDGVVASSTTIVHVQLLLGTSYVK